MSLIRWMLVGCIGAVATMAAAAEQKATEQNAPEQKLTPQQYQDMAHCENIGKSNAPVVAIDGCTKVIDSKKWNGANLARAYVARGIAYEDKQDFTNAIADYSEAIKLDPKDARGYNDRCSVHDKQNELDLAIADCDQAITLDPKLARAYINRGVAYYHKLDYDHAIADYNQAIELDSKYAPAFQKRGMVYDDKQDYAHAIADYTKALDLDRRDAYSAIWLYVAQTRNGTEAHKDLETNAAKISHTAWPFPVIEMFLGKKSPEELLTEAKTPSTQCEAQFYVGESNLLAKAPAKAAPFLHKASETCPKDFVEYARSVAELKLINP